jgi:hypothetical protein
LTGKLHQRSIGAKRCRGLPSSWFGGRCHAQRNRGGSGRKYSASAKWIQTASSGKIAFREREVLRCVSKEPVCLLRVPLPRLCKSLPNLLRNALFPSTGSPIRCNKISAKCSTPSVHGLQIAFPLACRTSPAVSFDPLPPSLRRGEGGVREIFGEYSLQRLGPLCLSWTS